MARPFVCSSCVRRALLAPPRRFDPLSKRWISLNYLRKQAEAETQWQEKAKLVHEGKKPSMLSMLEERGYIDTIAGNRDALDRLMTDKRIGAYVGIDPTAPSLHVGHLLPLMTIFWLYVHGYHAVSLLGGATAKVGDPTDRAKAREKEHSSVRKANMVSMHYQLKKLWANVEQYGRRHGYLWEWAWHRELVNNNAWMNKLSIMEVLQILGPGVRMGTMLGRDTVKSRLGSGEGMSFSEFTYPLLQSWDWWHMYNTKGIQMQIGGADQFGNIVAGIDAIKYIAKTHPNPDIRQEEEKEKMTPYGFTVPLLTTAAGQKFGKTAGNAIWLDKEMTPSFDLYQFFLRSSDADVGRYLKLFTFVPMDEIDTVMAEHAQKPSDRKAQHLLAREFVELVHGEAEAAGAEQQHRSIFRKSPILIAANNATSIEDDPTPPGSPINQNNAPTVNITLPMSLVIDKAPANVLYAAGLVTSRSEGHRLAANQGAYIGSKPIGGGGMGDELTFTSVKTWDASKTKDYLLDGGLLVLRVGKWKVKIVRVVSDEEFKRLELDAPGWKEELAAQRSRAMAAKRGSS